MVGEDVVIVVVGEPVVVGLLVVVVGEPPPSLPEEAFNADVRDTTQSHRSHSLRYAPSKLTIAVNAALGS